MKNYFKKILNLFILTLCFIYEINAQINDTIHKITLNGYISNLQNATFSNFNQDWLTSNLLHNRLNFKWYATDCLSAALEVRTRFVYGEAVKADSTIVKEYDSDPGLVNMYFVPFHGKSYLLSVDIDRFWLAYEKNKVRVTLGRQRINWGQTFVWNPNDLFNSYSFFDFDYVEKPGSDALRIQYFNSAVSSTELAAKMNNNRKVTCAGLLRFNAFEYDFQFLGGILNDTDIVAGTGWSGAIKSMSFRGEVTYLRAKQDFLKSKGDLVASVMADYTFNNSFKLMSEILYNQNATDKFENFEQVYSTPLTVSNLSPLKLNIFVQASYPITPLLTTTLSGIYFPGINGYFINPSIDYSLSQNIDFSFLMQSFNGRLTNSNTGNKIWYAYNLAFLRLKLSF
jgi:hypothetical protein